ncbi:MAG: hypothetical protein ABJB12_15465 [Pseudomonadota bacterium]
MSRGYAALPGIAAALGFWCGCAATPPAQRASAPLVTPGLAPSAAERAAVPSARAPEPALPPTAPDLQLEVAQVLSLPVSSIALGEGTRVAVLSDPPQVGDERGFHALPLPASLRAKAGEVDDVRIYFGRDNEPRIMGTRRAGNIERPIYWRHTTAAGWRDGREEIGQLGGPAAAGLWGVLGAVDPELVCRAGALCIIKRISGWKTAPAGAEPRQVVLQNGVLWGLSASGISSIDAHGWALAIPAPAWAEPRAFWATEGEAWVSTEHELFRFHEGAWSAVPLPLPEPTSFWGLTATSVWLAGKGGVAHFDGQSFRTNVVPGQMRIIVGRANGEIWFGGSSGLFRAVAGPVR